MPQLLAAAYHLTQQVELEPSQGSALPRTVGGRASYDCEACDESMRDLRGGCFYRKEPQRAQSPAVIDSTGSEAHDLLWVCPRGLVLREPLADAAVQEFFSIDGAGGASSYYGKPAGLLPRRVLTALRYLKAIDSRFEAEVMRTRRDMDRIKRPNG